jgi:hypothetical protein
MLTKMSQSANFLESSSLPNCLTNTTLVAASGFWMTWVLKCDNSGTDLQHKEGCISHVNATWFVCCILK